MGVDENRSQSGVRQAGCLKEQPCMTLPPSRATPGKEGQEIANPFGAGGTRTWIPEPEGVGPRSPERIDFEGVRRKDL